MRDKGLNLIHLLLTVLITSCSSFADDFNSMIKRYQRCNANSECKKIEHEIIRRILSMTDVNTVLEEKLDVRNVTYKISAVNLSGSRNDYVIQITYDRLGYVCVVANDQKENEYSVLPLIETGPIIDVKCRDLVGDGLKSILVWGYGISTGEQTEWLAIYKFRSMRLELIWSGILEAEYIDENGNIKREKNDVSFVKAGSRNMRKIVQLGEEERVDKKGVLLERRAVSREFLWDPGAFKYLEKKKDRQR